MRLAMSLRPDAAMDHRPGCAVRTGQPSIPDASPARASDSAPVRVPAPAAAQAVTPSVAIAAPAAATSVDEVRALRHAFGHFPTGVTIVTTRAPDGRPVGLTVNSFASLSLEPPLLSWSLASRSVSREVFRDCDRFAINVLSREQAGLARRFATPMPDKFDGVPTVAAASDMPLLAGALAHFVCRRSDAFELGDHILFVGRIESHAVFEGEPLVFCRGAFGP